MKELLIATKNPGKFHEIMEVFGELSLSGTKGPSRTGRYPSRNTGRGLRIPFKFIFLGEVGVNDGDFVEDGESFKENAYKKAKYYFGKTGILTYAEDSGIFVDALGGELGVKTRRWGLGEGVSDEGWLDHFMKRMEKEENRNAKFVCHGCLVGNDMVRFFEGETSGIITLEIMAPILPGLPLSSCFLPEGCDKVYAALSTEEKNKISHRGKVLKEVKEYLERI